MVGGTSAGHLAPMVAVAEALETLEPGIALSFICSDKPSDAAFLMMEKRASTPLPLPRRNLALPFTFAKAFIRSVAILNAERPDVVFSKGSAVSVPLCYAAWMKRIPVVLHESDVIMGKANRWIKIIAKKVCLGWERASSNERVVGSTKNEAIRYSLPARFVVTGNPIRARITQGDKKEGLRIAGFDGTKPILLVMGGSQGARAINECIAANLDAILASFDVIHLTGAGKTVTNNRPGYYATEFGSDVLPHLYGATTLAVSRAGAGSFAELTACGIPSVLIPIKGLAHDHQVKNAAVYEATGATIVLPQTQLAQLPAIIASLATDLGKMQTMRDRCRYAARPEAARLIAETIVQSVARKKIDA